jgi:tetratricopeptide (TPR) repeat protein
MIAARPSVKAVFQALLLLACAAAASGDDASKKKERAHSHLLEARRLAADYKMDKAADKAHEALNDDPTLAEAHVYLGVVRFRVNDLKGAEAEFSRALELDPYQAAAHCQLAYVRYQQGQLEDATDHWTLSSRLDSTSPQALAGVALSQFKRSQEEEAVKTFDKVLMYDRRFADSKFLGSDNGPKWSGPLLQDFEQLLAKITKRACP